MNCGSMPCALAQRVPKLPSTASLQGNCGLGEHVTGLLSARFGPCALAVSGAAIRLRDATRLSRASVIKPDKKGLVFIKVSRVKLSKRLGACGHTDPNRVK